MALTSAEAVGESHGGAKAAPRASWLRKVARLVVLALALGGITGFYRATGFANHTTIALTLLLLVLGTATVWGLFEAIVASFLATLCFNYFFIPPVGTWTIADPENWIALLAFLIVSIVASQLSERARRKTGEAIAHQQETERLYTLSRMILKLAGNPAQVAEEVPHLIRQVFEAAAAALYLTKSARAFWSGEPDPRLSDEILKGIASANEVVEDSGRIIAVPVSLSGEPLGSLGLVGARLSEGARRAVVNLVAIAVESAENREVASLAELARKSEKFKSTLLDALAHELKTPLTSLKASVTAMQADASTGPAGQRELLAIVVEETERLEALVSEVLRMARAEAGKLRLNRRECSVRELVDGALREAGRWLEGRNVEISVPAGLPHVSADAELIQTVLRRLLENAAKYSPPATPVRVLAEPNDLQVRISVADCGPGLSEEELSLVFERYYRGAITRETVSGAGMGLAIARDILAAHGRKIWAESAPGRGAQFFFTLPIAPGRERT